MLKICKTVSLSRVPRSDMATSKIRRQDLDHLKSDSSACLIGLGVVAFSKRARSSTLDVVEHKVQVK